jgi:para-nitrobenzyl esterase
VTATIVTTGSGRIRGEEIEDGVLAWRGIPYAAAPVGPLRWRLPQPAPAWSGVRDAVALGAPSLQPPREFDLSVFGVSDLPPTPPPSEDCLFANVTAPADARDRPVLVWIHGGGYQEGSGTDLAGDGAVFAREHGIVVVTFNYRLGATGFLSLPGEEHTGAYGLHDQIALLRWVKENIAAFGGDPRQVTLYGVSAGGKSVSALMGSELARGLFRRAASSSGGDYVASPERSASLARRLLAVLGVDADADAACAERARRIPSDELLQAQRTLGEGTRTTWLWRPAIDGLALRSRPTEALTRGSAAGVALLAQHCVEECAVYQMAEPDSAAQADRVLEGYFGPAGRDEILAAYAASAAVDDPEQLRLDIMTDERYAFPITRLADAQSAHAPVWRSRYDGPLTGLPEEIAPDGVLPAFHGTDAFWIWNAREGVAKQLQAVWAAFVTSGSPAAAGVPEWPAYSPATRPTMLFGASATRLVDDPRAGRRRAWEGRVWEPGPWFPVDDGTDDRPR